MNPIDEPPDPRQARILLVDYLGQLAAGKQVNGELRQYSTIVFEDLRGKIADLRNHGKYALALDKFANGVHKGAGGPRELEGMLNELSQELSGKITPARAEILKKGIEGINAILG